jgi:hypothetical protein
VEQTIKFQTRSSDLLDPFMKRISVEGKPGEVAQKIARHSESGESGEDEEGGIVGMTTGQMYTRWKALVKAGKRDPALWDDAFKNQTGANVNVAVNGIAGLLNRLP